MPQFRAFKDSWSVNTFCKRYEKGSINFDNPIQRGLVWNKPMSSLYIHSLLYDILVYQKPFLISKKGEEKWDVLDGKQRGTSLIKYINNEFRLTGLQGEPPIIVNGEPYNINGKFFKQLPDELQWKIKDFPIDMAVLEDAPVEMESLFFNRSNGGKAMAKVDLARSKNKSIATVKEIAKHEIFSVMFSDKTLEKLPQDEVVVKTWQALNETTPDYSSRHFNNLMETLDITEFDKQQIISIYDKVLSAYQIVLIKDKDVAINMMKKTHFLTYISFVEQFENTEKLAEWLLSFYKEMPPEYFEASNKQTTSTKNTNIRISIVKESVDKFLGI
ncbi:MAG: DUF262 domain-containing protein [Romboutsia timonensis]